MKKIIFILTFIAMAGSAFSQVNSNIRCRIWQTSNFCVVPDSVVYYKTIDCVSCNWDYYSCAGFSDAIDEKAVWLTMTGNWTSLTLNKDSSFNLVNHLKNISVTKKNTGKVIYPYAILLDGHPDYMKSQFTAKKYIVTYDPGKRFDLLVIFINAEKGDTFKIDGFIETEIK
jgi:hypothetical protein